MDDFQLNQEVETSKVFPGAEQMLGNKLRVVQKTYSFLTEDDVLMCVKINAKGFNPDDHEDDP